MTPLVTSTRILLVFCLSVVLSASVSAIDWTPVSADELKAEACDWSAGADAEVLYSKVNLFYRAGLTKKACYRRVKAYTKAGVEKVEKFDITYPQEVEITSLAARVTKPDGRIREFSGKQFKEILITKTNDQKWKSKRLLLSQMEPGDVLELSWQELWDGWRLFQSINCQESLPVREFFLRSEVHGIVVNLAWCNMQDLVSKKVNESTFEIRARHIPVFEEEQDMPPELERRGLILITFVRSNYDNHMSWGSYGGALLNLDEEQTAVGKKLRAKAEALISGLHGDEAKLRAVYEFCQKRIVNTDYVRNEKSSKTESREWPGRKAAQVLEDGRGNSYEINWLFVALSKAVSLDARIVAVCPRDLYRAHINRHNGWVFMAPKLAAVSLGGEWRYFDPGAPEVGFGELRWQHEGVMVLLSDKEKLLWQQTPASLAVNNRTQRSGTLQLSHDGSLEGELRVEYQGKAAIAWRLQNWRVPPQDIEKAIREEFVARIPTAELSEVVVEGLSQPGAPLVLRQHVRIPSYATEAGGRLLLIPNVFEAGRPSKYTDADRKHPVVFPYSFSVQDELHIRIPDGYQADLGDVPQYLQNDPLNLHQSIQLRYDPEKQELSCIRDYNVGVQGSMDVRSYQGLVHLDEQVRSRNDQAILIVPETVTSQPVAQMP